MNLKEVLTKRIDKLKNKSYRELSVLINSPLEVEELFIDNKEYQLDVRVFYEDSKHGVIRVTVSVFEPKEQAPWWKFWRNIDSPILSDGFSTKE